MTLAGCASKALIIVLLTLMNGCSYGNPPVRFISGKRFPVETARQLKPGLPMDDVRKVMGEPLAISRDREIETWHYSVETQKKEQVRLLGLIPIPAKERGGKTSASLRFQNRSLIEAIVRTDEPK